MDTIFALATARGRAGVAVVRISGPLAHYAAQQFCDLPDARQARLRWLKIEGEVIDQALVLAFAEGHSFTGEAMVEFHLHGSQAVINKVIKTLAQMPNMRLAEAGEFTRRAMNNGKLDLTQVEGLADLIDAESESQRKQALRVLSGAIAQRIEPWRSGLIRAAALIEATIDFAEEDLPVDVVPEVSALIHTILTDLYAEQRGSIAAERIRDGFEVAIIGAPNIGKSTLLNALARRDVAITSDIAGTTRDVIEVRLEIGGYSVTVLDTAGLREALDSIEKIGIERAMGRAEAADIRVFLLASPGEQLPLQPMAHDIVLLGKGDAAQSLFPSISGKTGQGIDDLLSQIAQRLDVMAAPAQNFVRQRHQLALIDAAKALQRAQGNLPKAAQQPELLALDLRVALHALEGLLGHVGVEDLLGEIFSSFCIGK
jgi:tRNA modification GTPase